LVILFAEMEGPGCIWRIWSATAREGRVRIYLDGAAEPAVDLPFTGYFNRQNAPFTRPVLVHTTAANGYNNYTPIPYQKSCKIVADPGWGQYYQFVYTTFPKGTQVPTFKKELTPEENAALDDADRRLGDSGPRDTSKYGRSGRSGVVSANGGVIVDRLDGPNAITMIRAKVDLPAPPADRDVLRELTLQIGWDGEASPSVWAPFGDFFGTAPGANPYLGFPCGLTKDGWWYANWYMPFGKSAEVKHGDQWSGDAHLWWINAKPGDRLELALPVETSARYEVTAQLTKARDYGIVQLWLDGKKLGEPIDLYAPNVLPLSNVKLGLHDLPAGVHKLTVEITGANEKAVKSYMFGLDYVKLVKVR
jgi:hypothetical protein